MVFLQARVWIFLCRSGRDKREEEKTDMEMLQSLMPVKFHAYKNCKGKKIYSHMQVTEGKQCNISLELFTSKFFVTPKPKTSLPE